VTRLAACACVALAALGGCSTDPRAGYSFTQNSSPAPVASVAVPIFRNETNFPGVEQQLTEAVIKQVQGNTTMRVVQSSRAQSALTGIIRNVEMRRISLDSTTGLVQELAFVVTVDFEWRDARSGEVLVARRNFSAADTFVPARPTGERIEVGRQAAVERLARDIVSQMRSAW
jgi:hypothetical protein